MVILAVDTTSEYGGAGVFLDSQCLADAAAEQYRAAAQQGERSLNYSVILFQIVEALMAQANLNLSDIGLFAVAKGPGSFTGIRVGIAAVQAWAQAFTRPAAGISILEALAEQAQAQADWVVPIMDARRGEFFVAAMARASGSAEAAPAGVSAPIRRSSDAEDGSSRRKPEQGILMTPQALTDLLLHLARSGAVGCVYREHDQEGERFRAELEKQLARGAFESTGATPARSAIHWQIVRGTLIPSIARLALRAHEEGRAQTPAELDALYVRRSDAEMRWTE